MARQRRSSEQVLRDLAKKEKHDATESTRETGEDRPDTRDSQAPTGSATEATSTSEETDSESDETAGGSTAEEKQLESSTRAGAKVTKRLEPRPRAKPIRRTFAQCPHCGERRYPSAFIGISMKCSNCRTQQTLV